MHPRLAAALAGRLILPARGGIQLNLTLPGKHFDLFRRISEADPIALLHDLHLLFKGVACRPLGKQPVVVIAAVQIQHAPDDVAFGAGEPHRAEPLFKFAVFQNFDHTVLLRRNVSFVRAAGKRRRAHRCSHQQAEEPASSFPHHTLNSSLCPSKSVSLPLKMIFSGAGDAFSNASDFPSIVAAMRTPRYSNVSRIFFQSGMKLGST